VLEHLRADTRTDIAGSWTPTGAGAWSLPVIARLSVPASAYMPAETLWHLVVGGIEPEAAADLYPDRQSGLKAIFQHQDADDPSGGTTDWSLAKPCLERRAATLARAAWDEEPLGLDERLIWRIGRLLQWIDAAATNTLVETGDPLELPSWPGRADFPVFGFREEASDFAAWNAEQNRWGFATTIEVPNAKHSAAITGFLTPDGGVVREVLWTSGFAGSATSGHNIWIRLPGVPIIEPWRLPLTWAELHDRLMHDEIDLPDILALAGARYRSSGRKATSHRLLLGFPFSERVGDSPDRLHWLVIEQVKLAGRTEKRQGFRPTAENHRRWDRDLARSAAPLAWRRTVNWAPDQIRKRGQAEYTVRGKRILIIGGGALGSSVADNLLRMGVTDMAIMDGELLDIGNLSRHVLTMAQSGHGKAVALATQLNATMPDACVSAFQGSFPPAASILDQVRAFDVIVDCTASDHVLDALAAFDWGGEKIFVSLSITWRAEGLLAFCASEAIFPAIDAKSRFAMIPGPDADLSNAPIEGIGCWHAVFPATADDVHLWGAIGSKAVRRAILQPARRCDYYSQLPDGSVERRDY
jgi:hypothetical protein